MDFASLALLTAAFAEKRFAVQCDGVPDDRNGYCAGWAARGAVQAALTVYTPEHTSFYHEKLTRLLSVIEAELAGG